MFHGNASCRLSTAVAPLHVAQPIPGRTLAADQLLICALAAGVSLNRALCPHKTNAPGPGRSVKKPGASRGRRHSLRILGTNCSGQCLWWRHFLTEVRPASFLIEPFFSRRLIYSSCSGVYQNSWLIIVSGVRSMFGLRGNFVSQNCCAATYTLQATPASQRLCGRNHRHHKPRFVTFRARLSVVELEHDVL